MNSSEQVDELVADLRSVASIGDMYQLVRRCFEMSSNPAFDFHNIAFTLGMFLEKLAQRFDGLPLGFEELDSIKSICDQIADSVVASVAETQNYLSINFAQIWHNEFAQGKPTLQ